MEAKETFTCEEIKDTEIKDKEISNLIFAFCYSLFFQVARFNYNGVAARTYNKIISITNSNRELPQLKKLMQDKSSVNQIHRQLSFSYEQTKKEFVNFISNFTNSRDVEGILNQLAKNLEIMIRTIFYEDNERKEIRYFDEANGTTIMVNLFYETKNLEKVFFKTQSSWEIQFDENNGKYEDRLRYHPFTFNPVVYNGDFNLRKVNFILLKMLKEQIDYIPIRKLEPTISAICGFEQTEFRSLLNHAYFECTHSNIEFIRVGCCETERCKDCLKEKISREQNCFCGMPINDNDKDSLK